MERLVRRIAQRGTPPVQTPRMSHINQSVSIEFMLRKRRPMVPGTHAARPLWQKCTPVDRQIVVGPSPGGLGRATRIIAGYLAIRGSVPTSYEVSLLIK